MNQYIKSMSGRMVFLGVFFSLLVPCNTRFVRLYIEVEYFWVLIAKVLESNRIPSLKSIVLAMSW